MNNSPLSSEGLHDQSAFLHLSGLLRAHSVTCMHACGRAPMCSLLVELRVG